MSKRMTTLKPVSEVVEELLEAMQMTSNPATREIVTKILNTLQATHEREKRELVREIHEEVGDYNDGCGCCMEDTASVHIKAIATRHNIDLSDPTNNEV